MPKLIVDTLIPSVDLRFHIAKYLVVLKPRMVKKSENGGKFGNMRFLNFNVLEVRKK